MLTKSSSAARVSTELPCQNPLRVEPTSSQFQSHVLDKGDCANITSEAVFENSSLQASHYLDEGRSTAGDPIRIRVGAAGETDIDRRPSICAVKP